MKNKLIFIFLLLSSIHVWGLYYNIGDYISIVIDGCAFLLILWLILHQNKNKRVKFKIIIISIFIALFISTISCQLNHEQPIIATVIAMRYFAYLLIYFCLESLNLEKRWLEKFIIICAIIYMAVFLVQVIMFPKQIVDVGRIEGIDRGLLRFRIEGAGFLMLAGFLSLNRFMLKRKYYLIIFFFLCLIFLFMLGFRTLLLTSIITSIILTIKISNRPLIIIRNVFIVVIMLSMTYFIPIVKSFVNDSIEQTEKQIFSGENYIRYRTYDFYIYSVNKNTSTLIFGNGFPQEESEYGKYIKRYGVDNNGYIFQDLGLIGFGIIYGFIALSLFLLLSIKAAFLKTDKNNLYLGCYFIYLLLSSFTTVEIYRIGIFGIEALALHLLDISSTPSKISS